MADSFQAKMDFSGWDEAFDALEGPAKESLARRMAVAGGKVLRDAAKREALYADNLVGEGRSGQLSDAIYLAYDSKNSTSNEFTYSVSWNSKKAFYGHMIEFGHWMPYDAYYNFKTNLWVTRKDQKREGQGLWVAARSFLRPTMDRYGNIAVRVMIDEGRKQFEVIMGELT